MKSSHILILFILSMLLSCFPAFPQGSPSLLQELVAAYQRFDYQETDRLIALALKEIESFSLKEKIGIYQYAAFRKFQQGDTFKAAEFFWKLLEIDPTHTLDPLTTSPKILALFQKTKLDFLEDLNRRVQQSQQRLIPRETPWRALVFPGWEQYHRGYRWKGAIWMTAGAGCLVGITRALIRTHRAKQDYEQATKPDDISAKYHRYNNLYQSQFYWSYALIGVWVTSQVDAFFFSPHKIPASLSVNVTSTSHLLRLTITL